MSPRDNSLALVLNIPSGPQRILSGYVVETNMAVVNNRIVERVQGSRVRLLTIKGNGSAVGVPSYLDLF